MGCAISGSGLTPRTAESRSTEDESPARLTPRHIHLIKESWKVIQEDIAKVGIIMFVRLFETHPECKDVFFLFRDVEDLERLRTSRELRAHGLRNGLPLLKESFSESDERCVSRVMSFIEKSVARLDQLERLETLALELGKSHYRYNAPPKYYGYVGAEFICAVQPILKDKWTAELEQAWKTLFQYVTGIMKEGYLEEERTKRNLMLTTSTKERPDKRNTMI
ncbi:Neuroglobin [Anabarilius grahami]|uniref:Neuroglobin n=1 Tax=Anabarilius grahami TaxID=495550 RepID=A0A3N0XLM5_ANAGA|nr:Neuroglobin [Anabarilius grahami]